MNLVISVSEVLSGDASHVEDGLICFEVPATPEAAEDPSAFLQSARAALPDAELMIFLRSKTTSGRPGYPPERVAEFAGRCRLVSGSGLVGSEGERVVIPLVSDDDPILENVRAVRFEELVAEVRDAQRHDLALRTLACFVRFDGPLPRTLRRTRPYGAISFPGEDTGIDEIGSLGIKSPVPRCGKRRWSSAHLGDCPTQCFRVGAVKVVALGKTTACRGQDVAAVQFEFLGSVA